MVVDIYVFEAKAYRGFSLLSVRFDHVDGVRYLHAMTQLDSASCVRFCHVVLHMHRAPPSQAQRVYT